LFIKKLTDSGDDCIMLPPVLHIGKYMFLPFLYRFLLRLLNLNGGLCHSSVIPIIV